MSAASLPRTRLWDRDEYERMIETGILGPASLEHDRERKARIYAQSGVPEYWIVNPQTETITVLKLENGAYVEHGVFARGQVATSLILTGFQVSVDDAFNVDAPPDAPDDATGA